VAIMVAQVGWIGLLVANTGLVATLVCAALLMLVEAAGPVIAETRKGGTRGTPGTSPSGTACW
jgi:hypothetical protein